MKTLKLLLLGIIWLASNELSFEQKNWVIEAKVGSGNTNINTTGNFPDLVLTTNSHTFISFGVLEF
jgi:hypothetical protein